MKPELRYGKQVNVYYENGVNSNNIDINDEITEVISFDSPMAQIACSEDYVAFFNDEELHQNIYWVDFSRVKHPFNQSVFKALPSQITTLEISSEVCFRQKIKGKERTISSIEIPNNLQDIPNLSTLIVHLPKDISKVANSEIFLHSLRDLSILAPKLKDVYFCTHSEAFDKFDYTNPEYTRMQDKIFDCINFNNRLLSKSATESEAQEDLECRTAVYTSTHENLSIESTQQLESRKISNKLSCYFYDVCENIYTNIVYENDVPSKTNTNVVTDILSSQSIFRNSIDTIIHPEASHLTKNP